MRKSFALLVLLLSLAACQRALRTDCYEDDLAMPAAEGSTDSLLLSISLEYVTGGADAQVRDAFNEVILTRAFDLENSSVTGLEETAIRYRENLIDEYLTECAGGSSTWEDRMAGQFTGDWKGWKNYRLSYYQYRGGAHGIQTVSPVVFEAKTGRPLEEKDLFVEGYEGPVTVLLQEAVTESLRAEAEELLELLEIDLVVPNNNFSVGAEGVEWVFQPYEVGPYALGIVSATVPWEQLNPYLK